MSVPFAVPLLFIIISMYENIFSDRKKNDKDIEDFQGGKNDRRAERFLFLVHLLKFESDTATSKDISRIRLY